MLRQWIPKYFFDAYHRFSAIAADVWYGHPSHKLFVIGVTGTNGKTTTAHFIAAILEAAGKHVGLLSTIALTVGGEERVNQTKMTTLANAWQVQKLLAEMVAAGDTHAVVETTSHALDQYRVHRVAYDIAVITNVTHEHLDYHKTMDRYRKAKERLFAVVTSRPAKRLFGEAIPRVTIMNADDPSAASFLRYRSDRRMAYGFGARPQEVEEENFVAPSALTLSLQIPGKFTIANACAAIAVARSLAIPDTISLHALSAVKGIPGRLERIQAGQPFVVMIDYAVTPDSFEKLAELVRSEMLEKNGRWWWVFGATGERDRAKRPILGEIAGRTADFVVLTNEDPFHEDPERILDEVEAGVVKAGKEKEKNYWRTLDRRAAIRYALAHAKPGDVVTITGKGAETAMAVGDERIPWNERQIVREILNELIKK